MIFTFSLLPALAGLEPQHASFHPPEAVLYVEAPDVRALADAYAATGLWRMLADEDVHAALGPLAGQESLDPRAAIDSIVTQALEQQGLPSLAEVGLLDVAAVSVSLAVPIGELFAEGADPEAIFQQKARATLVLEFTDAEPADAFQQVLAGAGLTSDAAALVSTWHEDRYVAVVAGNNARGEFDRRVVRELASLESRRWATDRFSPASGVTVIQGFSAAGDLASLPRVAGVLSEAGPVLGLLRGTFGGNLGVLLVGGDFRMQLRQGRFVTESFRAEAAAPADEGIASAPSTQALALLDPQALVGGVARLEPAALMKALTPVSDTLLHVAGAGAAAGLEEAYGFEPQRDLLAPLGSTFAFSLGPITGPKPPDFRVVCSLSDRESFLRGMAGLARVVRDLAGEQVELKESTYRKTPLYTFSARVPEGAGGAMPFDLAAMFRPTVAVLEDRVLLTLNSSYAKDEIRRLAEVADATASEAAPSAGIQLAQRHVPADAFEAGFSDWIGMAARLYATLKSLAPMAASFGAELPFDPEVLPEADTFARFFQPGYHWQRRVEGGVLCYAESSLGPEAPLLLLGSVAAVGYSIESGAGAPFAIGGGSVEVAPPPQPAESPTDGGGDEAIDESAILTRGVLAELQVAIAVYREDQGALPESLADLTRTTASFPEGFLGGQDVPPDGWGRELRYVRSADEYRLWSLGADGADQDGGGDDVTSR